MMIGPGSTGVAKGRKTPPCVIEVRLGGGRSPSLISSPTREKHGRKEKARKHGMIQNEETQEREVSGGACVTSDVSMNVVKAKRAKQGRAGVRNQNNNNDKLVRSPHTRTPADQRSEQLQSRLGEPV